MRLISLVSYLCIDVFYFSDNAPLTENLPLLLLHQFRFMDHVANPDLLTTKLVHLLDATSKSASTLTVQRQLIECIPEIMPDSGLEVIVDALEKCMQSNPREVTCVVLDTLGTIGVPSNMLVRQCVQRTSSYEANMHTESMKRTGKRGHEPAALR